MVALSIGRVGFGQMKYTEGLAEKFETIPVRKGPMPTVFAAVSATAFLFYVSTGVLAYFHVLPVGLHMLWGLFTTTLLVLLQCLVFGFFIGSGKTMKRVVKENGLSPDWIERTKDYKNKCYPPLMLAIVVTTAAAVVGGGVSTQSLPSWVHQTLVWAALATNAWSFWVSYRVIVENVKAIHAINREIAAIGSPPPGSSAPVAEERPVSTAPVAPSHRPIPGFIFSRSSFGCRTSISSGP